MPALKKKYQSDVLNRQVTCKLCLNKSTTVDYKDPLVLRRFLTEDGKIISRAQSDNCNLHQREITLAIKRCRQIGLVPL